MKYKLIILISIIIMIYNMYNHTFFEISKNVNQGILLQNYGFTGDGNLAMVILRYVISFIFNVDINDYSSYFKMFGV